MHKKIVITGASGFIGSCIVRYLNDLGISNLLLVDDIGKSEMWKNLVGKSFSDIISIKELFSYLQGREEEFSSIIHMGACTNTMEEDMSYLLENNYHFSRRLAEYALKNNVRFLYASSAATYGDGKQGFDDDENRLKELRPINRYAYSKHLFDLWLLEEKLLNKVTGFKFFNVFGPNEWHKGTMASMVYHMTKTIQKEGEVRLFKSTDSKYADGEQKRDFIYAKDVVRMVVSFLNNEIFGIFNIGNGEAATWNFIAREIFRSLGKKENIKYIDMPTLLVPGYQNYTCANMEKYKKATKEKNVTSWALPKAIEDYVKNYILVDKRW